MIFTKYILPRALSYDMPKLNKFFNGIGQTNHVCDKFRGTIPYTGFYLTNQSSWQIISPKAKGWLTCIFLYTNNKIESFFLKLYIYPNPFLQILKTFPPQLIFQKLVFLIKFF